MKTLEEFIEDHKITAEVVGAAGNPNMDQGDWYSEASHWTVTLTREDRTMKVPFSQGAAHKNPPTAADVLECLASDAASYENSNGFFEDWCNEYGYDTDSREAEKTYNSVAIQTLELGIFLGTEAYNELLWETEQL